MALISPDSTCVICDEPLDRPFTATSGCAFQRGHLLWRYCDAPMHYDCLEAWEHRQEFSAGYYEETLASYKSGYGTLLLEELDWYLASGPSVDGGFPYFAESRLIDWPFSLYTLWKAWDAFLAGKYAVGLSDSAKRRATEVIDVIRRRLPTRIALEALYRQLRSHDQLSVTHIKRSLT